MILVMLRNVHTNQAPHGPDGREQDMAKKTLQERIIDADERGSRYLADANEAAERGEAEKAERLYEKGQFWLDRLNKLLGNS